MTSQTKSVDTTKAPEMLSGAAMVIRALADEGVEYLYGYPGGAVLHIYDALFQQNKVKHVLVRHEQAATHMADAYARAQRDWVADTSSFSSGGKTYPVRDLNNG